MIKKVASAGPRIPIREISDDEIPVAVMQTLLKMENIPVDQLPYPLLREAQGHP